MSDIDRQVAKKVMGQSDLWMDFHDWSPTTNASHDYEVLVKVREDWGIEKRQAFSESLEYTFIYSPLRRELECGYFVMYQIGDYSRAALKVLEDE